MDVNQILTPDAVVLYQSRGKLLLLVLGAAGFVAGSVFIWRTGETTIQVIAIVCGAFSGACSVFGLIRLIHRQPALIINATGILENSSALGGYFLRWDEIEGVYFSFIGRQRFLSVRLKHADDFIGRQPALRARLMKANVGLVGAPVNISANTLPVTLEELVAIIRQKCPTVQALSQE